MNYFDEYTSNYDLTMTSLNYKYYHSIRVMNNMEMLAKKMNLSKKDIKLARCIGLLHDIGRFEQYKRYQSFDDFNIDHGDYGEQVLRETDALSNYEISKSDYEVVYKAIRNHNKFEIETGLSNRELLFAKMIRDADKLDILYAFGNKKLKKIFEEDDSNISEIVKKTFFENKQIRKTPETTMSDDKVMLFAFIYDINFDITKEIIKKHKLFDKIYKRLEYKEKFKPYIEHINKYMDGRTD